MELAYKQTSEALEKALGPRGRKVAEVDGQELATVSMTKRTARINTMALLEWAKVNYPEEVTSQTVTTYSLSPLFMAAVKRATEKAGQPCGPGGELDIPGVSLGDGYLTVRPAEGSAEAIDHLWSTGRLGTVDLPLGELEDGRG